MDRARAVQIGVTQQEIANAVLVALGSSGQ